MLIKGSQIQQRTQAWEIKKQECKELKQRNEQYALRDQQYAEWAKSYEQIQQIWFQEKQQLELESMGINCKPIPFSPKSC